MTIGQIDESTRHKPLRLWPGVVIVVLQWLGRFGLPIVVPEAAVYGRQRRERRLGLAHR